MGIKTYAVQLVMGACANRPVNSRKVRICELGNQHLKYADPELLSYLTVMGMNGALTGKELFTSLGMDHTSIDINGRDGALPYDLCCPLPIGLLGEWDIVTNFGTSEHVPYQYNCFKNIHDLASTDCVMLHIVSANPRHGGWNYNVQFFHALAEANHYMITMPPTLETGCYQNHVACVLKKVKGAPFCSVEDFPKPIRVGDFEQYRILTTRRAEACP